MVMRDIIQKVVATEAEAKRMVQAAQSEAERILLEARKRAQELAGTARVATRLEAEKMLATALQTAEADKKERLAHADTDLEMRVSVDKTIVRQTAEAVVRCVCGYRNATRGITP